MATKIGANPRKIELRISFSFREELKIIQQLQVIYTRFAAARNREFGLHLRSINGQTHSKVASISKAYNFLIFFLLFFANSI